RCLRRDVLHGHHDVAVVLPANNPEVRPLHRAVLLAGKLAEREFDGRETSPQALRVVLAPLMAEDLNSDPPAGAGGDEEEALAGLGVFQRDVMVETPRILWLALVISLPLGLVHIAELISLEDSAVFGNAVDFFIHLLAAEELGPASPPVGTVRDEPSTERHGGVFADDVLVLLEFQEGRRSLGGLIEDCLCGALFVQYKVRLFFLYWYSHFMPPVAVWDMGARDRPTACWSRVFVSPIRR